MSIEIMISLALVIIASILSRFPRLRIIVLSISVFLSVRYLLWRGLYTLNKQDFIGLLISVILYLAEIYGFIQYIFFHYQSAKPTNPQQPAINDSDLFSVDIFVTIYNEPKEILYRTLIGCQAQNYPEDRKKVYVLDDGKREEIKEIVQKLG